MSGLRWHKTDHKSLLGNYEFRKANHDVQAAYFMLRLLAARSNKNGRITNDAGEVLRSSQVEKLLASEMNISPAFAFACLVDLISRNLVITLENDVPAITDWDEEQEGFL